MRAHSGVSAVRVRTSCAALSCSGGDTVLGVPPLCVSGPFVLPLSGFIRSWTER